MAARCPPLPVWAASAARPCGGSFCPLPPDSRRSQLERDMANTRTANARMANARMANARMANGAESGDPVSPSSADKGRQVRLVGSNRQKAGLRATWRDPAVLEGGYLYPILLLSRYKGRITGPYLVLCSPTLGGKTI